jgi:hypothetical protein
MALRVLTSGQKGHVPCMACLVHAPRWLRALTERLVTRWCHMLEHASAMEGRTVHSHKHSMATQSCFVLIQHIHLCNCYQ